MSPFIPGGVSDGQWHVIQVHYYNKVRHTVIAAVTTYAQRVVRLRVWVVLNSRLPSGFSEERVGWLLGVLHALTCVMEEFLRDPHALEQSHAVGSIHAS